MVFFVVSLVCSTLGGEIQAPTSEANIKELTEGIQRSMAATTSICVAFNQTKTVQELPFPLKANGVLLISPPDSLRFEFVEPFQNLTIRSSQGIAKYEKDQNWKKLQTRDSRMMDLFFDQLFGWFTGDFDSSRHLFEPTLLNTNDNYQLILTSQPDRLKKHITSIIILIHPETYAFRSITISAGNGDVSVMEFGEEQRNLPLDPELFSIAREAPLPFTMPSSAVTPLP